MTGTVADSAGAVISGATVTATNAATNTQRTVTTSAAGVYNLTALPPGTYSLRIEMKGFSAQVRSNIELQVAQVARFDVSLQVGNVTEVVEVQGGAPLIETDNPRSARSSKTSAFWTSRSTAATISNSRR